MTMPDAPSSRAPLEPQTAQLTRPQTTAVDAPGTANDVEARFRYLVSSLPAGSPHAALFSILLARLPRRDDGSIDFNQLEVTTRLLTQQGVGAAGALISAGAPIQLIEMLPT